MKNSIIGLVAVIIIVIGGWYYVSNDKSKSVQKVIGVTVSNQGPFRYFQIAAAIEPGVVGDILLNDEKIFSFSKRGGSFSKNEVQDFIKDGANSIQLKINSADEKDPNEALLSYTVEIELHALNEPGVSTKENEILRVKWNQAAAGADDVLYNFSVRRDNSKIKSSDSVVNQNTVTNNDKSAFVSALDKRKNLFATKDAKSIKAFYVKILPADSGIAKKSDSQILAMAERDLDRLVQTPFALFDAVSTKWTKSSDSVQAIIYYSGSESLFSTKIIGGVQY